MVSGLSSSILLRFLFIERSLPEKPLPFENGPVPGPGDLDNRASNEELGKVVILTPETRRHGAITTIRPPLYEGPAPYFLVSQSWTVIPDMQAFLASRPPQCTHLFSRPLLECASSRSNFTLSNSPLASLRSIPERFWVDVRAELSHKVGEELPALLLARVHSTVNKISLHDTRLSTTSEKVFLHLRQNSG